MTKLNSNNEWWETRYNEGFYSYLLTHLKSSSHQVTKKEVDLLVSLLSKNVDNWKNKNILDIGGGFGRHAIELVKRGAKNITVIDQSDIFLKMGQYISSSLDFNKKVKFIKGDARNISKSLKNKKYQIILCLGNSILGYFSDPCDDYKFLREVNKLLTKSGVFILDIQNSEHIINFLDNKISTKRDGEISVVSKRSIRNGKAINNEKIYQNGKKVFDNKIEIRLYSQKQLIDLLNNAGFSQVTNGHGVKYNKKMGTMACRDFYIIRN